MISKAVKDYFRSFSLKRIFGGQGFSYFWVVYVLVMPLIFDDNNSFSGRYYITYYGGLIPFFLGLCLMMVNPIQLSKIMFLSPFTREQRLQYLKARFFIRIAFPIALLFIFQIVVWCSTGFEPWELVAALYVVCSIVGVSFSTINGTAGVLNSPREQREALQKEKSQALKGMEVKSLIIVVAGMVGWAMFIDYLPELIQGAPGRIKWLGITVFLMILLVQIVLTLRIFRYLPAIFSLACDYERTGKLV